MTSSFGVALVRFFLLTPHYFKQYLAAKSVLFAESSKALSFNDFALWGSYFKPNPYFTLCSSLGGRISHVISLGSQKKVIWSHTTAVIAFVTDIQTFIKRAISKFIGKSVGHKTPTGAMWAFAENTVSVFVSNALPFPAFAGFFNLHPKTLGDGHTVSHEQNIAKTGS